MASIFDTLPRFASHTRTAVNMSIYIPDGIPASEWIVMPENIQIKLHTMTNNGMYTLHAFHTKMLHLKTKWTNFKVPIEEFKCLAGGLTNAGVNWEDPIVHEFLTLINTLLESREKEEEEEAWRKMSEEREREEEERERQINLIPGLRDTLNAYKMQIEEYEAKNKSLLRKAAASYLREGFNISQLPHHKSIKFIYQESYESPKKGQILLDPLGYVGNFHSSIHYFFNMDGYSTLNGGHLTYNPDENSITLFGKSSDYGRYDGRKCVPLFKKLFPGVTIKSMPPKK